MFWKKFEFDFFGIKKLKKEVSSLVEQIVYDDGKPYRNILFVSNILTVVFKDNIVVSMVSDYENIEKITKCSTKKEILDILMPKVVEITKADEKEILVELEAKEVFFEHKEEVLNFLDDRFTTIEKDYYYNGINLPIPTILVNSLLNAKKEQKLEVYESLVKFWLWSSLNHLMLS